MYIKLQTGTSVTNSTNRVYLLPGPVLLIIYTLGAFSTWVHLKQTWDLRFVLFFSSGLQPAFTFDWMDWCFSASGTGSVNTVYASVKSPTDRQQIKCYMMGSAKRDSGSTRINPPHHPCMHFLHQYNQLMNLNKVEIKWMMGVWWCVCVRRSICTDRTPVKKQLR